MSHKGKIVMKICNAIIYTWYNSFTWCMLRMSLSTLSQRTEARPKSIASEKEVGQYFMNYEDALGIGQLCSQTSLEYIVLCHWSKAPGYKYKIGKHGKGNPPTVCLVATIIDQNEPI